MFDIGIIGSIVERLTYSLERRYHALAKILLLAVLPWGCAETVRSTTKEATPEAVKGVIETAHDPNSREQMADLLADPRLRGAAAQLTHSLADGAFDALTEKERLERFESFAKALAQEISAGVAKSITQEIRPVIAATVTESTERVLSSIFSQENEKRASEFALAVSRAVVRGMTDELGSTEGIPGSALQPTPDKISRLAMRASQGVALGLQDAVSRSEARRDAGDKHGTETLASVGKVAKAGVALFSIEGLIVLLLGLGLLGGLIFAIVTARHYRAERLAREELSRALAHEHPGAGTMTNQGFG